MSRVSVLSVARSPALNNRGADTSTSTLTVQPNLQMVSGASSQMLASLTSRKTLKQIFISKYLCKEAEFRLGHPPLTSVNLLLIETISRKHAVNLKNALY